MLQKEIVCTQIVNHQLCIYLHSHNKSSKHIFRNILSVCKCMCGVKLLPLKIIFSPLNSMYLGSTIDGYSFPSSHLLIPKLFPPQYGSSIKTSTNDMTFICKTCSFQSRIFTTCSSYEKSSQTCNGSYCEAWAGLGMYFYNINTWNILWMCDNSGGKANW